MFSALTIFASIGYLGLLFLLARVGEKARRFWHDPVTGPPVYALTLAIYCTGWTFYGAVGTAVNGGWTYLPIYLGPVLMIVLARPILSKSIRVGRLTATSSISDFIAARYGKSARLAALVTLLAVVAGVPYVALQLRALSSTAALIAAGPDASQASGTGFAASAAIAAAMALLVMTFGLARARAADRHSGLMLAVALESVVKLAAFMVVAVALAGLADPSGNAVPALTRFGEMAAEREAPPLVWWISTTLLSALAMLCLPRQFHVAVVEAANEDHLRTAAWIFPLYLALFVVAIPTIAITGVERAPDLPGDTLVLSLPMVLGRDGIALIVFLGGLAAATGMLIVAGLALATMVTNDLILPVLLKRGAGAGGLGRRLVQVRRLAVAVIFAAAWGFDVLAGQTMPLAAIGLLAFAGVAQFAPALIGGLYWRRAHEWGAMAGLSAGGAVWLVALVGPSFAPEGGGGLATDSVAFAVAVLASLAVNIVAYVVGSLLAVPNPLDEAQADLFVDAYRHAPPAQALSSAAERKELEHLVSEVLGPVGVATIRRAERHDPSPEALLQTTEQLLAAAVGTAAARVLLARAIPVSRLSSHDARAMLGDATMALATQLAQLRLTVDTVSLGMAMIGADGRISLVNPRFQIAFGLNAPGGIAGLPLARALETVRLAGGGTILSQLEPPAAGTGRRECLLADGRALEIAVSSLPDGGRVVTVEDVTGRRRTRELLERSNEELERRVAERTADLEAARAQAEAANAAKTRFLAACGHDLMQPLAAARLFAARMAEDLAAEDRSDGDTRTADRMTSALDALEQMIAPLMDIARLDGGTIQPSRQAVSIDAVLSPLAAEAQALAEAKGLGFRYRARAVTVDTDPHWLRRIVQNFLTNALRYTEEGGVLLGCRVRQHPVRGTVLRIGVWDTGPGIAQAEQQMIFEEFRRLQPQGPGLGLGLAIVERSATMLDHPLTLHSRPGRGSQFAVDVPLAAVEGGSAALPPASADRLVGARVTVLDDDPAVRAAMVALLEGWGVVVTAYGAAAAIPTAPESAPDLAIVDYRLGPDRPDGLTELARLRGAWQRPALPAILITAEAASLVAERARLLGADLLAKPAKPARLRALLARRLSRARVGARSPDRPRSTTDRSTTAAQ